MRCSGWLAVACGLAAVTAIDVECAAAAVAIGATSATVQNPGDTAQICVVLATSGTDQGRVAGTQNDLTWDGNCAILADNSDCQIAARGKELSGTLSPQGQDFSYRGLVLSFGNTNPISDGPLYCCNFIGEADPGQCCNITVMATAASDSGGAAIATMGNTAKLCTASSSDNNPARPPMGGGMNAPLSASNEAPPAASGNSGSASSAPQAAANSGASAAPPVQVLPGGGARVENPGGPAAPPIQVPGTPGLPQVPVQPAAGVPGAVAPAPVAPAAGAPPAAAVTVAAVPTGAPTKAAASPPPADTPTARAPAVTQPVPATKGAPAAAKAANSADPPAAAASNRGLLGCEVSDAASGVPFLALGLLALIGRAIGRRRRR
jgi:MYXO-CTERM domain-containing protein